MRILDKTGEVWRFLVMVLSEHEYSKSKKQLRQQKRPAKHDKQVDRKLLTIAITATNPQTRLVAR